MTEVKSLGLPLVEITGGEPFAQAAVVPLMASLSQAGFKVICETSGAEAIDLVPEDVTLIMDLKCPDSGMSDKNLWQNLDRLKPTDEIKFVIASRKDFDWAVEAIRINQLDSRFHCLMSVAFGLLEPSTLVEWILESKRNVRLNLQQHKYIWNPRKKGV